MSRIDVVDQRDPSGLAWLRIAMLLDGRPCVFCGFEWTCRDDTYRRRPIVANPDPLTLACGPCWHERHP